MANRYKKSVVLFLGLSLFSFIVYAQFFDQRQTGAQKVGQVVDQFNGVNVYYNGQISHVSGRNLTKDGYNLGQKYQCVEFIKRYYYERFKHKMPDSYGHAKDFLMLRLPMAILIQSVICYSFIMVRQLSQKLMILSFLAGRNMAMLPL